MALIRNISRLIIGIMFIFSGFVKAIDPLGSVYKFTDYFMAFQIEWLTPAALFFAVTLSALEFVIGFALVNNVFTRISSVIMFIFMSFFTALTLYLAINNPVSDCGCFGDAIKLTNWLTFFKNLLLMAPAAIVFWQRKAFKPRFAHISQILVVVAGLFMVLYLSKHSYNHLPAIDFRPYKIGTDISLAMKNDWQGAKEPVFETQIIYQKNDRKKAFSSDNLPDSTWKWVETVNKQIEKGYEPPIHNFNLTNEEKHDVTDRVLSCEAITLMIVAWDLKKIPEENIDKLREIIDVGRANDYKTFVVTASNPEDVQQFKREHSFYSTVYYADPITLKTIVRSNPGLVVMHDGLILNKRHYNDFPGSDQLSEYALYKTKLENNNWQTMMFIGVFMALWLLLSALFEIIGLKSHYSWYEK